MTYYMDVLRVVLLLALAYHTKAEWLQSRYWSEPKPPLWPLFIGLGVVVIVFVAIIVYLCVRCSEAQNAPPQEVQLVALEVARPDPDALVSTFPSIILSEEERARADECVVCHDRVANGELVRAIPLCNHRFHHQCILNWVRAGATTCPMCRRDFISTSEQEHA